MADSNNVINGSRYGSFKVGSDGRWHVGGKGMFACSFPTRFAAYQWQQTAVTEDGIDKQRFKELGGVWDEA